MRTGVSWREKLISAVFPARCAICGQVTAGGRRICPRCEEQSLPQALFRRLEESTSFDGDVFCVSPFLYEGLPRRMVLDLKFRGKKKNAKWLAERLLLVLPPRWQTADVVCWVPMSAIRKKERGYDQSELIARQTARKLGRPCRKLITKFRENQTQHELDARERAINVMGVYKSNPSRVSGKRILLIDDIVTTGATLSACIQALKKAGAAEIHCACATDVGRDLKGESQK